jgi:hypothetical protein
MPWRRGWDSNPRYALTAYNGLANRRLQPLGHPSAGRAVIWRGALLPHKGRAGGGKAFPAATRIIPPRPRRITPPPARNLRHNPLILIYLQKIDPKNCCTAKFFLHRQLFCHKQCLQDELALLFLGRFLPKLGGASAPPFFYSAAAGELSSAPPHSAVAFTTASKNRAILPCMAPNCALGAKLRSFIYSPRATSTCTACTPSRGRP